MDIKVFLLLGLVGLASCDLPFKRTCFDAVDPNPGKAPSHCSNYKNIEYINELQENLEKRTKTLEQTADSQKTDLSQLMEDFKKMKKEISENNKTHNREIATLKNKVHFLETHKQIVGGNVSQIEKRLEETETQLREKKERLEDLETETEAAFRDTKELLNMYKSELSKLNTTAQDLQDRVQTRLTATRTDLEAEVEKVKNNDKALRANLTEQINKVQNVEDQLDKLKLAVNTWHRVAFSASITEGKNVFTGPKTNSSHSVLIFNHVFTNVGNAYNSKTGVFTAPMKGVYQFTFMTFGYNSHTSGAILVRNGHYQVSTWEFQGPDYSDTTSNTVILQLNQNDCINIMLWQGGKIHTGVFSGFLLFTVS